MDKLLSKLNISNKKLSIILSIVFIISLIPIFLISLYNVPSVDDYNYSIATGQVISNGGIIELFNAVMNTVKSVYASWQGTYSAVALMSIQPGIFGDNFYFISTIVLLFTFLISNYLFIGFILKDILKVDKYKFLIIYFVFMFMVIQNVPSAVQGFYWWNGSIFYTFYYSLFLIEIYLVLKYLYGNNKYLKYIIPILSFFIAGGNYVTALMQVIILALSYLYLLFIKKVNNKMILITLVTSVIGLLISGLAPGNLIRSQSVEGMNPIVAILASFYGTFKYINIWFSISTLLYYTVISFVLFSIFKKVTFEFKYPLLVTIISYCILSANFTPSLYAQGHLADGRMANIIYYCFHLFLLINIVYYLGWIKMKFKDIKVFSLNKKKVFILFVSLLLIGFIVVNRVNYLSYYSFESIVNNDAQTYNNEYKERLKLYNSDIKDIIVKGYSVKPRALFFDDITFDPTDWRNQSVAQRYNKNSVRLYTSEELSKEKENE